MKDLLIVANYDNATEFSILWDKDVYYPKDKGFLNEISPDFEEAKTIYQMWKILEDKEFEVFLKTRYSTAFKKIIFIENGVIVAIK